MDRHTQRLNAARQQKFRNRQKEMRLVEKKFKEMEFTYKDDNFIINEVATGLKRVEIALKETLMPEFFKINPELQLNNYLIESDVRNILEQKYAVKSKEEVIKDFSQKLTNIAHSQFVFIQKLVSSYKRDILSKAIYDINLDYKSIKKDEGIKPIRISRLKKDLLKLNKLYYALNIDPQTGVQGFQSQLHPEVETNLLNKDNKLYINELTPSLIYPYYWGVSRFALPKSELYKKPEGIDNFQLYNFRYYIEQCLSYFSLDKEILNSLLNEDIEKYTANTDNSSDISMNKKSAFNFIKSVQSPFFIQDIIINLYKKITPENEEFSYSNLLEMLIKNSSFIDFRSKKYFSKKPEYIQEIALIIAFHSHLLKICVNENIAGSKQKSIKRNQQLFDSNEDLKKHLEFAYNRLHPNFKEEEDVKRVLLLNDSCDNKSCKSVIDKLGINLCRHPLKLLKEEYDYYLYNLENLKNDPNLAFCFPNHSNYDETGFLDLFKQYLKVSTGDTVNFSSITQLQNSKNVDRIGYLENYVIKSGCSNEDLFIISSFFQYANEKKLASTEDKIAQEEIRKEIRRFFPWVDNIEQMLNCDQNKYYWSLLFSVLFLSGKKYSNLLWAKDQFIDKSNPIVEEPLISN